jgi:cation diffusion facilitator family transporter
MSPIHLDGSPEAAELAAAPEPTIDHVKELKALKLSVALYVVVFAMKLGVYFYTGVMALLAEGLHTLSDIFVSGFLLVAAHWSRKSPDEIHMFGYGRAQYVGAIVAATLFISFTSFELYREALPRLFEHHEATHNNLPAAIGVLALSMLVAAVPLLSLLRQKKRGAAAKAQTMELINDQLGLVAALVGTVLVLFGYPIADPIAAVVVATIIGVNGAGLFWENLSYLVGRSPGKEVMDKIEATVRSVDGVLGVHRFRAQLIGPETVHAELHINVKSGLTVEQADQIGKVVTQRVRDVTPCKELALHIDPEWKPPAQAPKANVS